MSVNPLTAEPVRQVGFGSIQTGQATVAATATLICAGLYGRGSVTIVNNGTVDVFIGGSAVTTGTGVLLPGTKGASLKLDTDADVYGIVGTGTQAVSYVETY
jgi:hypothetical protein